MPPPPAAAVAVSPRVLCFGEALVDRLGPPGGDPAGPATADHPVEDRLGGAPANVACALGRLGTPSAFLGRLGEDGIGAAFDALFDERGVDTSALQWDPERPSRTVLVRRDADGERRFGGFAGDRGRGFADEAVSADELAEHLEPLLEGAAWLLVGTIPLASPESAAALAHLVDRACRRKVALAVDVNWRPTFWGLGPEAGPPPLVRQRIGPLLERASLLKCAAEEADWLFDERDPLAIHASLPRRPAVLITDGSRPLQWCLGGRSGTLDAFPVQVVDTTGAGDAFTAGLLHGLCRRPELLAGDGRGPGGGGGGDPCAVKDLMRFASACGALVCRGAGAIDPQPTEMEVKAAIAAAETGPGV
jgi:fructokinase